MYNQVKKSLIFRKFSPIVLIKQLTLCFIFALAAVLGQSAQGVQAADNAFYVLGSNGVVSYNYTAGFGYESGSPWIDSTPTGITIGPNNHIFVVHGEGSVHEFTRDNIWAGSGPSVIYHLTEVNDPVDIVFSPTDNAFYVLGSNGVVSYNYTAGFAYEGGSPWIDSTPTGITIGPDNHIFVVHGEGFVHEFTRDNIWAGSGPYDIYNLTEVNDPVDIVFSPTDEDLVIVNNMVNFIPMRPYTTIPFTNDRLPSECGCPDTSVGLFSFYAVLENTSNTLLTDLTVKVHTLTNDNLLVLARGNSLPGDFVGAETGGEGALWTLPASGCYDGRILYQGPSKAALPRFGICLKEMRKFDFYVDVLGTVR